MVDATVGMAASAELVSSRSPSEAGSSVAMSEAGSSEHVAVWAVYFRLYWMCLNTAYVMEFFMQTLVKRGYMSQSWMLGLQQLLMLVSTFAALRVLQAVRPLLCVLSLALNLVRRKREVSNGVLVLAAAYLM